MVGSKRKDKEIAMALRAIFPKSRLRTVGIRGHLPAELWALFLGRTMLSGYAYFRAPEYGVEAAQGEMFDYTSKKLRLRNGSQILELPMPRDFYE